MEQNTDNGVPTASAVDSKQENGNGLKIATAIACVVAVCGIGFGVYGMIDAGSAKDLVFSKNAKISDLNSEVTNLNARIKDLEDQINKQQDYSDQDNDESEQTSVNSSDLTAEVQDGVFVLKNSNGMVVTQDTTKNIAEIISCDSGTNSSNSPLKCTAKTIDGKSVWFIYDFEGGELKSGYSSVDY